jgi:hypothetical protein
MHDPRLLLVVFVVFVFGAGCAAQKEVMRAQVVTVDHGRQPAALERSLFKKPTHRENLAEDVIQRVINAPLRPEFPARAGVLILDAPFSRKSYSSLTPGDQAPQLLARRLEHSKHFVMVSDISPYLVNGQEIEALRELATRYRLKYLVIFNRRFTDGSELNRWGWAWLSLVGIPFAPAYTLRSTGLLEATLMDVRTGTFLFTTQVHIHASRTSTPWSQDRKLAAMELRAGRQAALRLADRFLAKCRRLVRHARVERQHPQRAAAARQSPRHEAAELLAPTAQGHHEQQSEQSQLRAGGGG